MAPQSKVHKVSIDTSLANRRRQALPDADHPSTLIVPLTAQLVNDAAPLRIRIPAAGQLEKDSDALVDQMRAIDNARLVQGPLSSLLPQQLEALDHALLDVFDPPMV